MKIGLTGSIGAGKKTITDYLKKRGFAYFHLGDEIREIAKQEGIEINRKNLQDLGNRLRREMGGGAIAYFIKNKIYVLGYDDAVIDSIRNPQEVEMLRQIDNFFLVAVDSSQQTRFKRIKERNRESDPQTWEEFLNVDARDFGEEDENGQQVGKCIQLADYHLENNESVKEFINRFEMLYKIMKEKEIKN